MTVQKLNLILRLKTISLIRLNAQDGPSTSRSATNYKPEYTVVNSLVVTIEPKTANLSSVADLVKNKLVFQFNY